MGKQKKDKQWIMDKPFHMLSNQDQVSYLQEKQFLERCENCIGCPYFKEKKKMNGLHDDLSYCDYLLMAGKRRNQDPKICTHKNDKIELCKFGNVFFEPKYTIYEGGYDDDISSYRRRAREQYCGETDC